MHQASWWGRTSSGNLVSLLHQPLCNHFPVLEHITAPLQGLKLFILLRKVTVQQAKTKLFIENEYELELLFFTLSSLDFCCLFLLNGSTVLVGTGALADFISFK